MANSNQFLAAQAEGLQPGDEGYPKAENQFTAGTRLEHPEDVRAKIQVSHIVNVLTTILDDSETKQTDRIAASKILLDKSLSSLSSVDQTVRDERDLDDPEKVEARLRMLIAKAEPALLSRILGERARESSQMPELSTGSDEEQAKSA